MNNWISVEDHLPEEGVCVLLCVCHELIHGMLTPMVVTGMYQEDTDRKWVGLGIDDLWNRYPDLTVTHWMKEPKPPYEYIVKEGEDKCRMVQ